MPVSSKQERITSTPTAATPDQSSSPLSEQQEFHQHLRALAQSAVRTVLELVMREELDALIGAAWGDQHVPYEHEKHLPEMISSSLCRLVLSTRGSSTAAK